MSACRRPGLRACPPAHLAPLHATSAPAPQACHKWWRILLASVRQTDLAAAAAEGDTSLRVCLAQLPFTDEQLMPNVAAYLIAG